MKSRFFKKILPGLLIVMILSVGIFGAFGVETVEAIDTVEHIIDSNNESNPWDKNSCGLFNLYECVNLALTVVGQAVLGVLALFLGIAGWALDYVVTYTVVEMGTHVKDIGFIKEGWKTFRDLANIVIIFALLVIGIATILRIEGYSIKKLLGMLIVVALLINFSLFFTQIIIDSTNLLALQFYNKILAIKTVHWTEGAGIGYAYMDAFKLTTIYNAKGVFDPQTLTKGLAAHQIFLVSVLASVVYLVAIFSFFAGAFLLIGRFVALIFLMVLSPLAFVGMILPATQKYASQWWSSLFKYAIFAPIYMILTWFVINVVTSPTFKGSIGLLDSTQFSNLASDGALSVDSFPIIMNFVLIIFFMMASLLIANQMGIAGSSAVMKWGQSARKWGQGVTKRGAKRGVGRMAEASLDEKSWLNKATFGGLGRVARAPIIGRGFAKVSSLRKEEVDAASKKHEKAFGKYSDAGLNAIMNDRTGTVSGSKKKAATKILNQRKVEDNKKKELEILTKHIPQMQSLVIGYKQQIKQADSDLIDLQTEVVAAEQELTRAINAKTPAGISSAKTKLNTTQRNKAQELIKKQKALDSISKIEKHETRKEKLEEDKARKGEAASLRSSISGSGKSTP